MSAIHPIPQPQRHEADPVWPALLAARRAARGGVRPGAWFAIGAGDALAPVDAADPSAVIGWREEGWTVRPSAPGGADPRLALYLPVCGAHAGRRIVVAHLGQSLDGFIATRAGESRFVTGEQNIVHLHRLRALCDAVVVGADTVATDDPRLTTRLVPGPSPVRVVLDPRRRVPPARAVFTDAAAPTLLVVDAARVRAGERVGKAELVGVPARDGRLDLPALLDALAARGCHAVFVEGGGATVSAFLAAGALDRLQLAIAPMLIGSGRPGVQIGPTARLADALRPPHRIYRMGEDVLYDFDLRGRERVAVAPTLHRID